MKRRIYQRTLIVFVLSLLVTSGMTAERQPRDHTTIFMRAKLAASNKVMEGIVTEDFELVRNAALQMKKMSQATQWPTVDDEIYQHHQRAFQFECDELAKHAKQKNLSAAHMSFVQLTTSCVKCHSHVRRSFKVKRDKENPRGPVILIPSYSSGNSIPESEASHRPNGVRNASQDNG